MVLMARIDEEVQELVVVGVRDLAKHIGYRKLNYRIKVCILMFTKLQTFQALWTKSLMTFLGLTLRLVAVKGSITCLKSLG